MSEAWAGNESTYKPASNNAGVLICTYNQRDFLRLDAYTAAYIANGESADLGCSDKKPLFESAPTSCQAKIQRSDITPSDMAALLLGAHFDVILSPTLIGALIKETVWALQKNDAKKVCNALTAVLASANAPVFSVPKGTCNIVSRSGSTLSGC
jgi:hypothetical protein